MIFEVYRIVILVSKYIVPKGYLGITLFPFIFFRYKNLKHNRVLVNHEKIHLRQQLELLVLFFYILYVIEFLVRFIQNKKWHLAYRNISFEQEAYRNEKDFNYLKKRSFLGFIKYY